MVQSQSPGTAQGKGPKPCTLQRPKEKLYNSRTIEFQSRGHCALGSSAQSQTRVERSFLPPLIFLLHFLMLNVLSPIFSHMKL